MEYAISIAVVAVFLCVYLITRPKIRALYFDEYTDEEYKSKSAEFVNSLPLPKEGGKTDAKKYASKIKLIAFEIKMKKYCGFFDKFVELEEEIKTLLKTDLTCLDELPSINGEPRAVKIARFCLAHTGYEFDESRVKTIIEEHNKRKTLSFSEIVVMKSAFIYVLIEKLCYIYLQ
ncbi:MAG: hypothetical protein NC037_04010, partial [Bacteroides sp.]|nr:hypothetical protein [Bacteroides sp.]